MNKKLFQLCLCACIAIGMNACDTGEYNDLNCDDSYVAECLSGNVYMTCNGGTLALVYCDGDQVCMPGENGASCVPRGDQPLPPTCTTSCALDGVTLNECQADGTTVPKDCSTVGEGYVCRENKCQAPLPEECVVSCDETNPKLLHDCQEQADGSILAVDVVCDEGEGHEGFVCADNTCKAAVEECVVACDETNPLLLHDCQEQEDGSILAVDVICNEGEGRENFICDENVCKEEEEDKCVVSCDETNPLLLHDCQEQADGSILAVDVVCNEGEGHENFVCSEDACKEAVEECVISCDATDPTILHDCQEQADGSILAVDVTCTDLGESFVCNENACMEACTESVCAEDGITLKECSAEGFVSEVDCSATNQICSKGACIAPASVVGMPCTCEGADCNFIYLGSDLKSLMTDLGTEHFSDYLDKISDDEEVVGPNFYSTSNTGCEDLAAVLPDGMTAACFRSADVTIPQSIIDLISTDFVEILEGYITDTAAESFVAFGTKLSEMKFAASSGYCMPAALQVTAEVTGQAAKAWDNEKLQNGAMFEKFTTGDHEIAKTATCPENSTFFSYEMTKQAKSMGHLSINFDFCMQNCTDDDDCRDGFSCIDLPEYGRSSAAPESKVCFDNSNVEYFLDLRAKLAGIVSTLLN